jgi:hypothetical protein
MRAMGEQWERILRVSSVVSKPGFNCHGIRRMPFKSCCFAVGKLHGKEYDYDGMPHLRLQEVVP